MPYMPHDIFEPQLCHAALCMAGPLNLGSLIFGNELWMKLASAAGQAPLCPSSEENPLVCFFSKPECTFL